MYLSLAIFKLKYILSFCKAKIALREDVSNGMQIGNSLVLLLCSVYSLFTLLSTKHENAWVGTAHQSDELSSCSGQCWFCDCLMCQKHCDGFLKISKPCVHYPNHRIFSDFQGKRKLKKK